MKTQYHAEIQKKKKKNSEWIGDAMCFTVVLLLNSNQYLSAGGATAVGIACLSGRRASAPVIREVIFVPPSITIKTSKKSAVRLVAVFYLTTFYP